MRVCREIRELREALRALRGNGAVGLVPTMGALHEGHRSLLAAARRQCQTVVASIFVNPTQFAAGEDFDRYPRSPEADHQVLEAETADVVFEPSVEAMYPADSTTFVDVAELSSRLDGASRPGHFRGVATVVAKLFNIVEPNTAFFGQKDAAQLAILRQMVRNLNFPIEIVACPTIREADGLAVSSRNRYLSAEERRRAPILFRALQAGVAAAKGSEGNAPICVKAMTQTLAEDLSLRVDYAAIVDPDTLLPLEDLRRGALLAVAAYVGNTRLIDNILLPPSA
jgi:pantoate--beta-alanine ligase